MEVVRQAKGDLAFLNSQNSLQQVRRPPAARLTAARTGMQPGLAQGFYINRALGLICPDLLHLCQPVF